MPRQRVLKVEQAQRPPRPDQHQVLDMIIAQHGDGLVGQRMGEHLIPGGTIALDIDVEANGGRVPFGQERRLTVEDGGVVRRQSLGAWFRSAASRSTASL